MRKVIIYTALYPFAKTTESYMTAELSAIAGEGYDITIVPIKKDGYVRPLEKTVKLDLGLQQMPMWGCCKAFFKALCPTRLFPSLLEALKLGKLKYCVDALKYLYAANKVLLDLEERAAAERQPCVFYCYWLSFVPVSFALYKAKHPDTPHKFVSRGHGSDIYATRQGVYYPMRSFALKHIDAVYTVSDYGATFLKEHFPESSDRIKVSKLGVPVNRNEAPMQDKVVRIISVASVYPFKRVGLLFHSLYEYAEQHPETQVEWTHCGDGGLFGQLKADVASGNLPNLKVNLLGRITNEEVLQLYRENDYTANVLLSTSEGIPVSIMESLASCVPVIATDAGGVHEIVNEETGVLLPIDFSKWQFDEALDKVLQRGRELKLSAFKYYQGNYSDNNFRKFYREITRM